MTDGISGSADTTEDGWITMLRGRVSEQMIDAVGHVNFLEYHRLAEAATAQFWNDITGQRDLLDEGRMTWILLEAHVTYRSEMRLFDEYHVQMALVAYDAKRFHILHRIRRDGGDACILETMGACFDEKTRRMAHFASASLGRLAELKLVFAGYEAYQSGAFRRLV